MFQIYYGVCVTVCVTASWVGATHAIKYLYLKQPLHTHMSGNTTFVQQQPVGCSEYYTYIRTIRSLM